VKLKTYFRCFVTEISLGYPARWSHPIDDISCSLSSLTCLVQKQKIFFCCQLKFIKIDPNFNQTQSIGKQ